MLMMRFCAVTAKENDNARLREVLSAPVSFYQAKAAREAGAAEIYAYTETAPKDGMLLRFLTPSPCLGAQTIESLVSAAEQHGSAGLLSGDTVLATLGPANEAGFKTAVEAAPEEGICVTDALSLLKAQEYIKQGINQSLLESGVILLAPESTLISPECTIGQGTVILPGCQLFGKTAIGENCTIGPNSLLKDVTLGENVSVNASQIYESTVGDGTTVGPFAYIRPGCQIGANVKVGDFVELKKSVVGRGTKISHHTYIGDGEFGENINVGCGVITVNYDGKNKHKTTIKDGAFIGCNVNLIAPVCIGEGAYVAAGTTVTGDVEPYALAVGRARQANKPGWAQKRRDDGKLK